EMWADRAGRRLPTPPAAASSRHDARQEEAQEAASHGLGFRRTRREDPAGRGNQHLEVEILAIGVLDVLDDLAAQRCGLLVVALCDGENRECRLRLCPPRRMAGKRA